MRCGREFSKMHGADNCRYVLYIKQGFKVVIKRIHDARFDCILDEAESLRLARDVCKTA